MIIPMKKYSFLVYHGETHDFLRKLGKLGVLHVIEREEPVKEELLKDHRAQMERLDRVLGLLKAGKDTEGIRMEQVPDAGGVDDVLRKVEETNEKIVRFKKQQESLGQEIERQLPWGEYAMEDLDKIRAGGLIPGFFHCTANQFDPEWEVKHHLFHISDYGGKKYFLVLLKEGEDPGIDAEMVEPGPKSLSALQGEYGEIEASLREAEREMENLKNNATEALMYFRRQLRDEIAFELVCLETQKASGDKISILEGWVPEDVEEKLKELLSSETVVSLASPPSEGDTPPVQLKNSRFTRLFEPISKLFDLPAYNELDLTPYFAPFFMLFFGFCLGDAGYGVFFILFAGLLKLKVKKDFKPMLTLAQYFGVATIVFGLLSGTFFGINLIDTGYTLTENSLQGLQGTGVPEKVVDDLREISGVYYEGRYEFMDAVEERIGKERLDLYQAELLRQAEAGIPFIGRFRHLMQDPLSMFYLSILIGGVQILFGLFVRILNITRRKGFRYALSTTGWLVLLISLILYFTGLLDAGGLEYIFYGLMAFSGVLIFFFNKPGIGILNRIGKGVWDSYTMATGIFGDLLSYIRLFALGISSAILGFVFNDISLQLLNVPYIGWLFFLIVLLAGHSINIFLATLGGFVHPMRLTFVEFYKNAGFKGGGRKYRPFIMNQ